MKNEKKLRELLGEIYKESGKCEDEVNWAIIQGNAIEALSLLPPPCKHYRKDKGCEVWCVPLDEEVPQYLTCKGYSVCPDYKEAKKPCVACGGLKLIPNPDEDGTKETIPCPACQVPAGEELVKDILGDDYDKFTAIPSLKNLCLKLQDHLTAQAKTIDEWEKRYEDITGGMMKKQIDLIQELAVKAKRCEQLEGEKKKLRALLKRLEVAETVINLALQEKGE